jgi:putative drug exporter of the RND superfamily
VVVGIFTGIGRFAVRFRWLVLAAWIVAAFAIPRALPSLSSVTQNNNADYLSASAPSVHASNLASVFQPPNQYQVQVIAYRSGGQLTTADITALGHMASGLHGVTGVTAVKDLGRSASGSAEQFEVLYDGQVVKDSDLVDSLRATISGARLPSGVAAHLAGSAAINVDQSKQSGSNGSTVLALALVFILALLLLTFRALLAPFVTVVPAFLVQAIAGPVIAELAKHGLKVSSLTQLMIEVLVIGAGTDYGLFLVFRVRENHRDGLDKREAVVQAVARVGESITFSGFTVIAALLSLLAASFGIYSNLGIPLAIAIGIMLIAGLTLLPAVLAILGRAVFWPAKPRPGQRKTGVWGTLASRIVHRPAAVLSIGVVLFGALALATVGYKSEGVSKGTAPPVGSDSAAGTAAQARYFPKVSVNPTLLVYKLGTSAWTDATPLATGQQQLTSSTIGGTPSQFTTVAGPLDPAGQALTATQLKSLHTTLGNPNALPAVEPAGSAVPPATYRAYRATAQYISPDGLTVLYSVGLKAGNPDDTPALDAVPAMRAQATAVATAIGATDSGVAGDAPGLYDVNSGSNHDLRTVIPIAIVVIGLLLALVMRSLVAPLYLILSVGISYLAALGLAVLIFPGGLTFILPFLMFVFLLALGEDYNILVMTRIREEAHHLSLRQAVSKALGATGTTVTSAGLVLAGTFAVFAFAGGSKSGSNAFQEIGFGLAAGIVMDTFLVRTLLVPSTVVLLGRWNWWPSRLTAHHDSLDRAEPNAESDTARDQQPTDRRR